MCGQSEKVQSRDAALAKQVMAAARGLEPKPAKRIAPKPKRLSMKEMRARVAQKVEPSAHNGLVAGSSPAASTKRKRGRPRIVTPEQRKEYLKLKARERRVRERDAAAKLGISIAEYLRRKKEKTK